MYFLEECGGFVEVNSKGSYSWDRSNDQAVQELKCTHNDNKTAKAECICDETVLTLKINRLICVTLFLL